MRYCIPSHFGMAIYIKDLSKPKLRYTVLDITAANRIETHPIGYAMVQIAQSAEKDANYGY